MTNVHEDIKTVHIIKKKKNFNTIKAVSYQTQTCQQDGTKCCNYALVFAGVPMFFFTKFRNVFMAHTKLTEWQKTMSINLNTHTQLQGKQEVNKIGQRLNKTWKHRKGLGELEERNQSTLYKRYNSLTT